MYASKFCLSLMISIELAFGISCVSASLSREPCYQGGVLAVSPDGTYGVGLQTTVISPSPPNFEFTFEVFRIVSWQDRRLVVTDTIKPWDADVSFSSGGRVLYESEGCLIDCYNPVNRVDEGTFAWPGKPCPTIGYACLWDSDSLYVVETEDGVAACQLTAGGLEPISGAITEKYRYLYGMTTDSRGVIVSTDDLSAEDPRFTARFAVVDPRVGSEMDYGVLDLGLCLSHWLASVGPSDPIYAIVYDEEHQTYNIRKYAAGDRKGLPITTFDAPLSVSGLWISGDSILFEVTSMDKPEGGVPRSEAMLIR